MSLVVNQSHYCHQNEDRLIQKCNVKFDLPVMQCLMRILMVILTTLDDVYAYKFTH